VDARLIENENQSQLVEAEFVFKFDNSQERQMANGDNHDHFFAVLLKYRKRLETFASLRSVQRGRTISSRSFLFCSWHWPIERPDAIAFISFDPLHHLAINHIRTEQGRPKSSAALAEGIFSWLLARR
jgi:hypothetical protein